jgi:LPXTG-site transpeptidase (sortase) family protein
VFSLTSADFTINPGFNGNSDIDLLNGTDSLAAGVSGSLSLIVDVDTGGDEDFYINTAVGTGDSPDGSTVQDTGVAGAPGFVDPALAKTANVSQASVGDTVIFTITVTNQGNVAAPNVIVTDTLPAMFDVTAVNVTVTGPVLVPVVNVTPAIGVGPSPYTVTVNIGTLEVTNVITIQIVTTVNSLGNPPIVNNAGLTTTAATNNLLNDNDSVTITLGIGPATSLSLPATGFAPGRETVLASQPAESYYAATDVILEIPRLGVKMPIVGVPFKNGGWDVSWLGNQAGWLEGSAFPSWSGNSVLTGHVYSATGSPGPFMNLRTLSYGDQVIIHANGQKYIFEIRSNSIVLPNDSSAFKHEELSWLTLITCKEFDPATNSYKKRVLVRAVLVSVE